MKPVSKIDRYVIRKVKEYRTNLGLSQADVGALLNVSAGFIGQVESDKSDARYNLRHLNELALAFKCRIYDLLPEKPLR